MQLVLGFVPFIVFALLTRISVDLALWAAFAVAFALCVRNFLHKQDLRLLDAGSVVLFGLFAVYAGFIHPSISVQAVRFAVDGGLCALTMVSLAAGRPFTLPYAREQTPREICQTATFLKVNYWLSGFWALSFAVMAGADLAALRGRISLSVDIVIGLAALFAAIAFSMRYPQIIHRRAHRPAE